VSGEKLLLCCAVAVLCCAVLLLLVTDRCWSSCHHPSADTTCPLLLLLLTRHCLLSPGCTLSFPWTLPFAGWSAPASCGEKQRRRGFRCPT